MNLVSAFEMLSPSGHPSFKRRGNLYDCISANYIDLSLKLILRLTAMPFRGQGVKNREWCKNPDF